MGPPTDKPASSSISREQVVALIAPLTELVARAGSAILSVDRARMRIDGKSDDSPVTEADLAADRIIHDGLERLAPEIAVLSEERASPPLIPGQFFLIDPLDGTREFVAGRGEFTVNLALVVNGTPILGIIGAPALGLIWRGMVGGSAERLTAGGEMLGPAQAIRTRSLPAAPKPWVAAVSRSHGDAKTLAFIDARPGAVRQTLGSAVKFAKVAEGAVDIYPRLAPTYEWDVAAGHAIVTAAGGKVTDAEGGSLQFGKGKNGFLVPSFIAWGDPQAAPAKA